MTWDIIESSPLSSILRCISYRPLAVSVLTCGVSHPVGLWLRSCESLIAPQEDQHQFAVLTPSERQLWRRAVNNTKAAGNVQEQRIAC
eukprot:5455013-Amphidinium_carterae.1